MYLKETTESLRHIGPGTAMGDLLRRYWVPALLEREIAGHDSVRVGLLGEDLVATLPEDVFRDAHRGAAYPIVKRGGVVWTYMGPSDTPPALPDFEWLLVQEAGHDAIKRVEPCSWPGAVDAVIGAEHDDAQFVPPFYTLTPQQAHAFVPIDDDTTCVWTFNTHAASGATTGERGTVNFRHVMIQLARDNARGHTPN
jgi:hypothetical protein